MVMTSFDLAQGLKFSFSLSIVKKFSCHLLNTCDRLPTNLECDGVDVAFEMPTAPEILDLVERGLWWQPDFVCSCGYEEAGDRAKLLVACPHCGSESQSDSVN